MDEELPRTESSVNNRSHLRQILNMEGLYRKNKVSRAAGGWLLCKWMTFKEKSVASSLPLSLQAQLSPLKTLLEIIVKHHVENLKDDQITISRSDPLQYAQTTNMIANSPAVTPTLMSDSKAEDLTAFVTGKHTKSWYFSIVLLKKHYFVHF